MSVVYPGSCVYVVFGAPYVHVCGVSVHVSSCVSINLCVCEYMGVEGHVNMYKCVGVTHVYICVRVYVYSTRLVV